jgi:hypothetical protein
MPRKPQRSKDEAATANIRHIQRHEEDNVRLLNRWRSCDEWGWPFAPLGSPANAALRSSLDSFFAQFARAVRETRRSAAAG